MDASRFYFGNRLISPILSHQLEELDQICRTGYRILDLGCGDGVMISDLINRSLIGQNCDFFGIDVLDSNIRMCKERKLKAHFVVGNANRLPFNGNFFDFIYSWMVIEHMEKPQKMVQEIVRVLRKGGKCYISSIMKKPWAIYFYRKNSKFVLDPTHLHEFKSQKEFLDLFQKNGLVLLESKMEKRKYSLLDLALKSLIRIGMLKPSIQLRNVFGMNKFLSIIQKMTMVTVPGFYQIEAVFLKKS